MRTSRVVLRGVFCLGVVAVVGSTLPAAPAGKADLILANGKVITVDANDTVARAVAIADGKILKVGGNPEILALAGPQCRMIDLQGRTVTPGLVDSHYHLMYYGQQFWPGYLNIRQPEVGCKADLLRVVGERAKQLKKGDWISANQGFHLDPNETLDRWDLDQVAPDNPVYLRHGSGQYCVVNSLALQIAGIDANTPNPYGSVIFHDSQGQPTGVLSHYPAENLVAEHATGYGDRTEEQKLADIEVGQQLCLQAGYTSVQDVIVSNPNDVKIYKKFSDDGRLKVRLYLMLYLSTEEQAQKIVAAYEPNDDPNNRLTFGGWKLAVDGGVAAKTILLYDKSLLAAEFAYPYHTQETLNRIVRILHDTGLQVAVHVSGDEGIDMTLTAFEEAMKANPRPDPRHRIEHGLFPSPAALQRMKEGKIILSTQPQWTVWHGDGFVQGTNEAAMSHYLPLRTMLQMGIPLAFGCDVPASLYQEPKWAFAGAALRRTATNVLLTPQERLVMAEVLRIHTMGSAYAGFAETTTGSLEPGKFADLVVWSHDLYTLSPANVNDLAAEMTIVNGEILYEAEKR